MSENEKKRKQAAIEKTLRIKRAMGLIPDEGAEAQQTSRSRENGQMSARSAGTGAGILKTVRAHGLDQNLHDSEVLIFHVLPLCRHAARHGRGGLGRRLLVCRGRYRRSWLRGTEASPGAVSAHASRCKWDPLRDDDVLISLPAAAASSTAGCWRPSGGPYRRAGPPDMRRTG